MDTITVDPYYVLIITTAVLLVGRASVSRIKLPWNLNIPEPMTGGLLTVIIAYVLHVSTGISLTFNKGLQGVSALTFFLSTGLSAGSSRLEAGSIGLVLFLVAVSVLITV